MKLKTIIACFFVCIAQFAVCQKDNKTIYGTLSDAKTGEPLIQAAVYDTVAKLGVFTNEYGFYSLTIPKADAVLRISYSGYGSQFFNVPQEIGEFNQQIRTVQNIDEVQVTAKGREETQAGALVLDLKTIDKLPVFLGEKDILRMLSLMPGVSAGGEGSTGIYVRGGGPDQNLILLDGVPVYNVSHLFGFFSVFNSDAISQITLYKSGFPPRFGGRVSSVLDMRLKEGNTNSFHTEGSIGLIASRILVEGPIKKGKTSFALSARRTYLDVLTYPFQLKRNPDELAGYFFYDVNAKIQHKINDKHSLYLSGYFGRDKAFVRGKSESIDYSSASKTNLSWGNVIGAVRWNYKISPRLFLKTTGSVSNYLFDLKDAYSSSSQDGDYSSEQRFYSSIRDYSIKSDLEFDFSAKTQMVFGLGGTNHFFTPGAAAYKSVSNSVYYNENIDTSFVPERLNSNEIWSFIEMKNHLGKRVKLNYGLHTSLFETGSSVYVNPQPRLLASISVSKRGSVKIGGSRSAQYLHLLTNQGIGLPTDLWVPATEKIPPVLSWEGSVGYHHNLPRDFFFSVESYYKTMKNVVQYSAGAEFLSLDQQIADKIEMGRGWSYGAEFLIQKKAGNWTGWIGYTLSWAWRQFDNLNNGDPFYYKYDRRHDLSITSSYQINKKWDVGMVFVFWTGNAFSLATQSYSSGVSSGYYSYGPTSFYSKLNNYRMPSYHRLDLSANRTKDKKWGQSIWSFSVYNVYNRQNAFFLFMDVNMSGEKKLMQQSLFPIVPSVSWKFIMDYEKMKNNKKEKRK